ncbi:hypothetical protein PILCRDRAFT_464432 [Piloderma croceum F 1598]|uniref:Uncharacterized protein n=1 Tax=Piloderma croceum (strain F 1598) TaxID=765440 RepID=A0A0C3FCR3_PILCF|nr:hypothetical protein PILCRDRAFT_464432 [Piloderma croceum F 1598]
MKNEKVSALIELELVSAARANLTLQASARRRSIAKSSPKLTVINERGSITERDRILRRSTTASAICLLSANNALGSFDPNG